MKPPIKLSNLIVKAYIKRGRGKISFHLNSHLLIPASRYFDSVELQNLSGKFTLSTGEQISFAKASWTCSETDYDYSFNDRTKVIEIHLSK